MVKMAKSQKDIAASVEAKHLLYQRITKGKVSAKEIMEESYRRKMITKEMFEDFLRIEKECLDEEMKTNDDVY